MVDYGKALRCIRALKDLRQEVLAKRAQISGDYLSQIEHGKRLPSREVVEQLAAASDTPTWALVVLGSDDAPKAVKAAAVMAVYEKRKGST